MTPKIVCFHCCGIKKKCRHFWEETFFILTSGSTKKPETPNRHTDRKANFIYYLNIIYIDYMQYAPRLFYICDARPFVNNLINVSCDLDGKM